jgi:hypothetical protein
MNCLLSNLRFSFPAFTLIRVHPRPSAVHNLPGWKFHQTAKIYGPNNVQ